MNKNILSLLALLALPAGAQTTLPLTAGQAYEAELAADPATLAARAALAPKFVPVVTSDAAERMGALADGILLTQGLPPPPGQQPGGGLPPPPGQDTTRRGGGLPPPPGSGGQLPPPPGQGGGRLPPPPGEDPLPRPMYPGGPLPRGDQRLENAERTYDQDGEYVGYWNGNRGYGEAAGVVETKPSDRSDEYILVLRSEETQRQTHFVRKQDGRVYWYPRDRHLNTETRRLVVQFVNRGQKQLLPWERESFTFSYKGDRSRNGGVELESSNGAYRYTYSYRFDPRDPLTMIVEMEAHEKLLTAADPAGVTARLASDGQGGLKLVVTDLHASYYGGEVLQITYNVKKSVSWGFDRTVLEATSRNPQSKTVPPGASGPAVIEIPLGNPGRGQRYYLDGWSFQRLNSALSRGGWIGRPGDSRNLISL